MTFESILPTGSNTPLCGHLSDYLFNMSALNRSQAKKQWRQAIKQAWNNCCAYCGKPPIHDSSLTIDHIKPKSKGGSDFTNNVTPACLKCNHSKGSTDWIKWYRQQPFYSKYRESCIKYWLSCDHANFFYLTTKVYVQNCLQ